MTGDEPLMSRLMFYAVDMRRDPAIAPRLCAEAHTLIREMLEALQGVVAVADRKTVEFDKARSAIAKATAPERTEIPSQPQGEGEQSP